MSASLIYKNWNRFLFFCSKHCIGRTSAVSTFPALVTFSEKQILFLFFVYESSFTSVSFLVLWHARLTVILTITRKGVHVFFLFSESDTNHILECFIGDERIRHCWCDFYQDQVCSDCRDSPFIYISHVHRYL